MAVDDQTLDQVAPTRAEAFLLGGLTDERRHRRIFISLPVRFLVADQGEYRGVLFDMSPGGISNGGNELLHASIERVGTDISSMTDSYWGPRYYTARRVVD